MTSLKTLANALGLSITQVSRALDDKPDVAAKTKVRVREMAAQMGYSPNAAARSLRKQKADMVAVVLPAGGNQIALGGLLELLHAAALQLASHGYDIVMVPGLYEGQDIDVLKRIVDGRRADAVIVLRTRRHDERVAFLTERGIPFITHGRTDDTTHAFVDGDGEAGFAEATKLLSTLGHRRIAHIAGPQDLNFACLREAGWRLAMAELGLKTEGLQVAAPPNEAGGYEATRQTLASRDHPTALLCATDAMAIGAYSAAREAGLVPGRSISIIGHDNLPACQLMTPQLTTMEIASRDVGKILADLLCARIGGKDPRDLQQVLPVRQVLRESHTTLSAVPSV